ncbi:AAA family ATPase [Mycolicibacterium mageritense]|uniref:AAA family ATPase n=1 Tax=Mycolicibacterium mageritense TaxID=53462 RepID=UPI002089EC60|nr:AAA family ATPase [Mycolicibacterium mageritense]GJJ16332.1 hypothetical protein MTY414_00050 [Mycolicibacterium mageritense]
MRAIALSGMMAAGKSTVSEALRVDHGFTVLAFGDVVRVEADHRGIPRSDRAALQSLGQSLFDELGADGLVGRLMEGATGDVVIDGVRHIAVLESLRTRLPSMIFGFLQADTEELDRRWRRRGESAARSDIAAHAVEGELDQLRDRADVVFDTASLTAAAIAAMLSAAAGTPTHD